MKTNPTALMAVLAAGWLALAPRPVAACGSDVVLGDEVGAAHPASIGVAFAMNDALGTGALASLEQPKGQSTTDAKHGHGNDDLHGRQRNLLQQVPARYGANKGANRANSHRPE